MGFLVGLMPAQGDLRVGLCDDGWSGRREGHCGGWGVGERDSAMRKGRGWEVGALGRGVVWASGRAEGWEGSRGGVGVWGVEWKQRDGSAWSGTEDGSEFHGSLIS